MTQTRTVETLLEQLTLEEQVSLLSGADFWRTVAVERLNIPQLKVSDGPAGVRGGGPLVGGKKTAAFPVGIALGSTWNVELLREIGQHLAREAKDKGAAVLLAPTMNLFRSTLNGRNFESYSEDPFLTGKLGVAYVQGLQERGVAATVKHFVGNESEYQRNTISSDIPERALRELYLVPFEMTVKEGKTLAVMSAYNKLNGIFASENKRLLTDILRTEWGFNGLVMSDWFGSHSAGESVRAGLDLEMPGPARARASLLEEAQNDEATREAVKTAARNVLNLLVRTGVLDSPLDVRDENERDEEYADTRELIRRAGAESIVLLKNEGDLLPFPAGAKVAVIGPNGAKGQVMGGGSAQMNAHRQVSPLEGLQAALAEEQVTYHIGCYNDKFLPIFAGGFNIEYRALGGEEVLAREHRPLGEIMWFELPAGIPRAFQATLTTTLNITEAGTYELSLASAGLTRLHVNGEAVVNNWEDFRQGDTYFGFGSDEVRGEIHLTEGEHQVLIEYRTADVPHGFGMSAVRFGFRKPLPETSVQEAAQLASEADYAVVCIGTNGEWETEGVDRWGLELPGRQDELVREVAKANPNTIVVLQTGGPVLMPWLADVPAVLQAWFPGQEAGFAITDVLLGQAEPGGRLPQTFPARLEDDPTHPETPDLQYPGENGHVEYQEGLFIGYRHVDRHSLTPLFPFGHGLSYTTFEIGSVQVSTEEVQPGETVNVTVEVRNTGQRRGQTVLQLYVHDVETSLERPEKELKAFQKVTLDAGESQTVTLPIDMRSFAYFDDTRDAWVADAGEFHLLIGQSSANLTVQLSVTLASEWVQSVRNA
ncbi:beta-glucosidase [Deinococcus cellulosilyticus]|uniref:Glycosyl hydrolase n=1 Tax=Deinococcus cellulosilyticus (strain DSM 18568 / NBRC 106333 / KACC 11606 / 5516J-15) TaxID=1223518 RepID=A0A511N093_DEIC1|nr:glycoside hydrolase family 3 C-terminal domain-containing protein [Deinococcus cellulosilyticus]GEM46262.1 glycosyl hydrolase [Deinococcus cellulosilyticus NBRC 106333 = KACC 11606]